MPPRLRFGAGPFERLSASSSAARSIVTVSGSSPRRRLAFVSPSVTYGPKRPSLSTTGFELEAESFSGSVRTDLPITGSERGRRGHSLRGTYNGGGAFLELATFSGSIAISKR